MSRNAAEPEESLDPQDWEELRVLGHQMVDDMLAYLRQVRERPTWQPMPARVRATFQTPLPHSPQKPSEVYRDFQENVLPYPTGNIHPRFWGWVIGTGTPFGMLAELLAAGMNPNCGGFDQSATLVEHQVIDWMKEMLGYPAGASGLLVNGGSMANLVGLAVARRAKAELDVQRQGLQSVSRRMTLYSSEETHSSVVKAADILGLGSESLRRVAVHDDYSVNVDALVAAIETDRNAGLHPFCVIGNAGTINTGACDDLERLADLCEKEDLWLHVDGAFGALAALSPRLASQVKGMERADSVAFDLHKWMYMPYDVGCTLVRNEAIHRETFSLVPPYLAPAGRGISAGPTPFNAYGVELSRNFKALKVWMSLKEHGVDKYARLIEQNSDQARYLAELVESSRELELVAPVPLNVVCFRFVSTTLDERALNRLNEELLIRLQESGTAVVGPTKLRGKYCLRAAITNHRSRCEDFDLLIREVVALGRALLGEGFVGTEA
jgi:glutamate/tyrosine decarboxylase-like PLP-dependent enzyme